MNACNGSVSKAGTGGSGVCRHPQVHGKFNTLNQPKAKSGDVCLKSNNLGEVGWRQASQKFEAIFGCTWDLRPARISFPEKQRTSDWSDGSQGWSTEVSSSRGPVFNS